ncbi:prostaglandin F2 receptor negative regulator-like [Anguilla anguilla]|uniref:prostaglandin F2 receptor negative regulator-like n=1 Tax=Anguilla anguilla TaxID=7936 RepID=UPI0015AD3090|nr:prostaglandin F2 receptor negative regulator-like [Anguilla anguilla]
MENAFFTYFILFLTFGWAQGRLVRVPNGPLVSVVGQRVSIRCSVSDYEGPREQDFDWTVLRGTDSLQVISTFDPAYSDRSLQGRVDSGDISMERINDNTVELKIRNLKATDSAIYRCSTPSTDSVIRGNYEDEVQLKVIADSLKVSPVAPPAVVPEGGRISLHCTATVDSAEHTSLSVAWSVRKGTSLEAILTFGPERAVTTGAGYRKRYADGGLRLGLPGGGAYDLVLTEALPADQGVYVCTAKQSVPEQGGVWQEILQRSVDMGEVRVTPTSQSLTVAVGANRTLSVDDTLNLTCSVAADGLAALGLEVTWLVGSAPGGGPTDSRVLARVSRDGVVTGASDLVGVRRVGAGVFTLVIRGVSKSDSGQYSCRVSAWIRQSGGEWYQAAEKTSNSATVLVTMLEPEFKVTLRSVVTPQASGDPTELECLVTDALRLQDGRLGVSWRYTETTPADQPTSARAIAAVDEQGNLQPGDEYRQRAEKGLLALSRVKPDTFRLRFLHTQDSDVGQYSCTVSVWTRQRDGGWAKGKEVQSNPISISWIHKDPSLSVSAQPLREASSGGSTFEMGCQATAENLLDPGYSVLIRAEETAGGKARKILSLSRDSVLKLEEWDELGRLDSVVLEKTGPAAFRFRLYGAQVSDRGSYSCEVTAWAPGAGNTWTKAVSAVSNKVQISFADTGPAFNVSIQPAVTSVLPGETAKIECVVSALGVSPKAGDVAYEVRWLQSRVLSLDRPAPLVSVDRWGVVRRGPLNGSSSDCSLEQTDEQTFALRVHGARDADAGEYQCAVTPWLRAPGGTWTSARELTSARVFLSVTFTLWDTLKLPLLYGVGASLVAGGLSILLGFACAQWCCRNTKHTPRSRNGLMDLEMD